MICSNFYAKIVIIFENEKEQRENTRQEGGEVSPLPYFQRRDAKTQSFFPSFYEHRIHEKNRNPFVHLVFSVFMFILTTDIQDLTDVYHERKRAYPSNLCNLCSKKQERKRHLSNSLNL